MHEILYAGKVTVKIVFSLIIDSTFNLPPCAFTISYANDNPKPVPDPVGLVVKKG